VPFGELSARAWLETPQSQPALALLEQTATLRSVMLLAGPNGVGKSALVGRWLSRLDRRLFCFEEDLQISRACGLHRMLLDFEQAMAENAGLRCGTADAFFCHDYTI
jgi:putative ribosome biogenesis GTPase RsgA